MRVISKVGIFLLLLIFIMSGRLYAMTQDEAGQTIALFAMNFFNNFEQETIYSVNQAQRSKAYMGIKTSGVAEPSSRMRSSGSVGATFNDKYAFDCVGFVSFCVHQSLKIGNANWDEFGLPTYCNPYVKGGFYEVEDGTYKPGDILANSGHVAIYIGENQLIDSAIANSNIRKKEVPWNSYTTHYRIKEEKAASINSSSVSATFNGIGNTTYDFSAISESSILQILTGTPPVHMTSNCKDFGGYFSWANFRYTSEELNENEIDDSPVTVPANIDSSQWIYPLVSRHTADPTNGARFFGANRSNGSRAHAGIDLIVAPGTKVIAMMDGTVIQSYNFYQNTDAVEVKNDDGTIVRYTEIAVSVRAGQKVNKGDKIGIVIANNSGSSMLHVEVYDGSVSGGLTQSGNRSYKNVPYKNYQRRSDLMNPTFVKDLPMVT